MTTPVNGKETHSGPHLLANHFVQIESVTCLVYESCVVFRHNAVSSTQGRFFLIDPHDLHLQPFLDETRHSCLPSLSCSTVLPRFKLRCCFQERDYGIYSRATEILMGPVRVYSNA